MTISEARKLTGMSDNSIRHWIRQKRIRAEKRDGWWFLGEESIEDIIVLLDKYYML